MPTYSHRTKPTSYSFVTFCASCSGGIGLRALRESLFTEMLKKVYGALKFKFLLVKAQKSTSGAGVVVWGYWNQMFALCGARFGSDAASYSSASSISLSHCLGNHGEAPLRPPPTVHHVRREHAEQLSEFRAMQEELGGGASSALLQPANAEEPVASRSLPPPGTSGYPDPRHRPSYIAADAYCWTINGEF